MINTYSFDLPFARDHVNHECQFCDSKTEATHWTQAEADDGETPLSPVVYHCEDHTQDAVATAWLATNVVTSK